VTQFAYAHADWQLLQFFHHEGFRPVHRIVGVLAATQGVAALDIDAHVLISFAIDIDARVDREA